MRTLNRFIIERLKLNKDTKIDNIQGISLDNFIKKYDLTISDQKSDDRGKSNVYIVPFKEKIFDIVKKQAKWLDSINHIKSKFELNKKDGWRINMSHPKDTTIRFFIEKKYSFFDWQRIAEVNFVNNIPWRFQNDPDCTIEYNIIKDEFLKKFGVSDSDLIWIEEMFFIWIDWLIEQSK